VVHWQRNVFEVPRCSAGKAFVSELARLFCAVGQGSALESVALKAVFWPAPYYYHVLTPVRSQQMMEKF